jgi:TatD DNase family protein
MQFQIQFLQVNTLLLCYFCGMILIDTHTHLYLSEFDNDRDQVVKDAIEKGVKYMFLPNINSKSVAGMISLEEKYPTHCFAMMGLHPTDVKKDYQSELNFVSDWLAKRKFIAVGEIGIDLYWDKTFINEQIKAFTFQIELARKYNLPIVIHSRDSMTEILSVLKSMNLEKITGVFHCFNGTLDEANEVIEMGFLLGIGGVVTFKNAGLDKIVAAIDLKNLLLETDAPFLTPVPHRGKRNESAHTYYVAKKIAEIKQTSIENVAEITTHNAKCLFKID